MLGSASKKASLFVCFILLAQLLMSVSFSPKALSNGTNLLQNPSFETVTNGNPNFWSAYGGWSNPEVDLSASAAHSGNYGISIQTQQTTNPFTVQNIAIDELATYEYSAWLKSSGVTGSGIGIKVEYYSGPPSAATWISGINGPRVTSYTGGWQQLSFQLTAPEGAKTASVYLRLYGTGQVSFDDASVIMVKPTPKISIFTDQIFYYSDLTQGKASMKVRLPAAELAGKTVDVAIKRKDTGATYAQSLGITAAAQLEYTFDPSGMQLEVPYEASAVLKDGSGGELETVTAAVYRWNRPTSLPADGQLQVNGTPFFPVIAYHVNPSQYSDMHDIGVNTVQGVATNSAATAQNYLDQAQANGLKLLFPLYYGMKVKENYTLMQQQVTQFKDHPALLGWMIMDEPSTNGISVEDLTGAYQIIRSIDDVHPVYMTEADASQFENYGRIPDVLAIDPYPLNRSPITMVGDYARKALTDVHGVKPVWTILQTFMIPGTVWNYLPNITEVRNMAYQAFLSGTNGFGYYSINDPGWSLPNSVLWPGLEAFRSELALMGQLATAVKTGGVRSNGTDYGVWTMGGDTYVVALNETNQPKTVTIPLPQSGMHAELLYGDSPNSFDVAGNQLTAGLSAYQTKVYKISCCNLVSNPGFENAASGGTAPLNWLMRAGTWDTATFHNGLRSGMLSPDSANAWNVLNSFEFAVVPGQTYVLNGWVKNASTAGSVALGIRSINAAGVSITYTWKETDRSSVWTRYELTYTAPANAVTAQIYFKADQAANGNAWLDDVYMR